MKDFIFGGGLAYQGCSKTFGKEEAQSVIAKGKIGGLGACHPRICRNLYTLKCYFQPFHKGPEGISS